MTRNTTYSTKISKMELGQRNFYDPHTLGSDVWYAFEGDTWMENKETLQIFISLLFTEYSSYAYTGGASLTEKRKDSMEDIFGDTVEVGEYYYRTASYEFGAYGISLKNAIKLYGEVDLAVRKLVTREKEKWDERERIAMENMDKRWEEDMRAYREGKKINPIPISKN